MKGRTWGLLVVALLAVFVLGVVAGIGGDREPEPVSASTSIVVCLLLLIGGMILLAVGGALLSNWIQRIERRRRLEDARTQAEVYALMAGVKQQRAQRRPAAPQQPTGPVVILGGNVQPGQPVAMPEGWRLER
jgi:hypothetical protein